MGVEALRVLLARHSRIALDTPVFIYQVDETSRYAQLSFLVFSWIQSTGNQGVTSTVTMTELLVQPYREEDKERQDKIFAYFSQYPNLSWIPADMPVATLAARVRALHRMRTPDALQAATALQAGATMLVTNDPIFQRVTGIEVAILDEFV